jgi:hypothetical protein
LAANGLVCLGGLAIGASGAIVTRMISATIVAHGTAIRPQETEFGAPADPDNGRHIGKRQEPCHE